MSGKALASDSESDDERASESSSKSQSESDDERAKKKMKHASHATKKLGKKARSESDSDGGSVDSECIDDLSGDEVDASNIIAGGRRTRRGRPTTFTAAMYAAVPLGSDSDDE